MKKKFSCGHIGKGQYCHLCKARDDAYEQQRVVKRAEKQAIAEATDVGIDMVRIPVPVALKAADIVRKLKSGTTYLAVHGKRLTSWDHNMISIPVGMSYRVMCKEVEGAVIPIEVLSHEQYNGRISLARR